MHLWTQGAFHIYFNYQISYCLPNTNSLSLSLSFCHVSLCREPPCLSLISALSLSLHHPAVEPLLHSPHHPLPPPPGAGPTQRVCAVCVCWWTRPSWRSGKTPTKPPYTNEFVKYIDNILGNIFSIQIHLHWIFKYLKMICLQINSCSSSVDQFPVFPCD